MPTGANPSELHVSHDGRTGYLSLRNEDAIDVIDLVARRVTRRIPVGDQPDTVQLSPDERTLVVALRATPAEVDVIDLRTFAVSRVVFPGERLAGHNWLSANGRYTYVSLDDPGGVGVIDHRRHSTVVATWTYPGGGSVHGMFYDDPRATGGPGLSILSGHASVRTSGAARIRIRCTEETVGFCRGRVTLTQRHRTLGSRRFYIRPGSTATIAIKLTAYGWRALLRRGRIVALGSVSGSDLHANRNRVSRRIVLRPARH
jgi:hypothetical protein